MRRWKNQLPWLLIIAGFKWFKPTVQHFEKSYFLGRNCGFLIPGSVQGKAAWGLEQPVQWKLSLPVAGAQNKMIFVVPPTPNPSVLHDPVMNNVRGASRSGTYDMRPEYPAAAKH